jgi:hypothetical protein
VSAVNTTVSLRLAGALPNTTSCDVVLLSPGGGTLYVGLLPDRSSTGRLQGPFLVPMGYGKGTWRVSEYTCYCNGSVLPGLPWIGCNFTQSVLYPEIESATFDTKGLASPYGLLSGVTIFEVENVEGLLLDACYVSYQCGAGYSVQFRLTSDECNSTCFFQGNTTFQKSPTASTCTVVNASCKDSSEKYWYASIDTIDAWDLTVFLEPLPSIASFSAAPLLINPSILRPVDFVFNLTVSPSTDVTSCTLAMFNTHFAFISGANMSALNDGIVTTVSITAPGLTLVTPGTYNVTASCRPSLSPGVTIRQYPPYATTLVCPSMAAQSFAIRSQIFNTSFTAQTGNVTFSVLYPFPVSACNVSIIIYIFMFTLYFFIDGIYSCNSYAMQVSLICACNTTFGSIFWSFSNIGNNTLFSPAVIPRYSAPGPWYIQSALCTTDNSTSYLNTPYLSVALSPAALSVPLFNETGAGDLYPPTCTISFTTTQLNLTLSGASINFTFQAFDDYSGIMQCQCIIYPPSQAVKPIDLKLTPSSGAPLAVNLSATLSIPQYSPFGNWTVMYYCTDNAIHASTTKAIFAFQVVSPSFAPPNIIGLDLSTNAVNTAEATRMVIYNISFSTSFAGLASCTILPEAYPLQENRAPYQANGYKLVGNSTNGIYEITIVFPLYLPPYTYRIQSLSCIDNANMQTVLNMSTIMDLFPNATVSQVGPVSILPPDIHSVSVSPSTINTSLASQTVLISAIADNMNGVTGCSCTVLSPISTVFQVSLVPTFVGSANFFAQFQVSQLSATGIWKITSFSCSDKAYRSTSLTNSELQNLYFNQVGFSDISGAILIDYSIPSNSINTSVQAQLLTSVFRLYDTAEGPTSCVTTVSPVYAGATHQKMPFPLLRKVPVSLYASVIIDTSIDLTVLTNIPRFSAPGAWNVTSIDCFDISGIHNVNQDFTSVQFFQNGAGDLDPPVSGLPLINSVRAAHEFGSPPILTYSVAVTGAYLCTVLT